MLLISRVSVHLQTVSVSLELHLQPHTPLFTHTHCFLMDPVAPFTRIQTSDDDDVRDHAR